MRTLSANATNPARLSQRIKMEVIPRMHISALSSFCSTASIIKDRVVTHDESAMRALMMTTVNFDSRELVSQAQGGVHRAHEFPSFVNSSVDGRTEPMPDKEPERKRQWERGHREERKHGDEQKSARRS